MTRSYIKEINFIERHSRGYLNKVRKKKTIFKICSFDTGNQKGEVQRISIKV